MIFIVPGYFLRVSNIFESKLVEIGHTNSVNLIVVAAGTREAQIRDKGVCHAEETCALKYAL